MSRWERAAWAGLVAVSLVAGAIVARSQTTITGGLAGGSISPILTTVAPLGTFGSVSVGTSASQVLAANQNRVSATICNNGSAVIYLGIGANAASVVVGGAGTANSGAPITVNGCKTLDRYTGVIQAISGSAAQDVRYEQYTTQ